MTRILRPTRFSDNSVRFLGTPLVYSYFTLFQEQSFLSRIKWFMKSKDHVQTTFLKIVALDNKNSGLVSEMSYATQRMNNLLHRYSHCQK